MRATKVLNKTFTITSGLYVPGNQVRMLQKCVQTKATLIVPDLEDSIPVDQKDLARKNISEYVKFIRENCSNPQEVVITPRVNDLHDEHGGIYQHDIEEIFLGNKHKNHMYVDGIMLPKCDTVQDIETCDEDMKYIEKTLGIPHLSLKIIPCIESTLAFMNIEDIFRYDMEKNGEGKRIVASSFGGDDFTANFCVSRSADDFELDFARKLFALTCGAYNITSIDTPYVNYQDKEGLHNSLEYLKKIGFKAKFALHPEQVDIINHAFVPSQEDVEYYQAMVEAFMKAQVEDKKAAISFRGKMVDIATFKRGKSFLSRYEQTKHLGI